MNTPMWLVRFDHDQFEVQVRLLVPEYDSIPETGSDYWTLVTDVSLNSNELLAAVYDVLIRVLLAKIRAREPELFPEIRYLGRLIAEGNISEFLSSGVRILLAGKIHRAGSGRGWGLSDRDVRLCLSASNLDASTEVESVLSDYRLSNLG